MNRSR